MALADIKKKIIDALERLLTLEIKTVVWDGEHGDRDISTTIRLATGDITTRMHADFINGDLDALRDYHAEQVLKGQAIIAEHVKTLVQLVNELRGAGGSVGLGDALEDAAGDQA